MTDEERLNRLAAKLTGDFYVGQRVKLFSGKIGTIMELTPTGAALAFDGLHGRTSKFLCTHGRTSEFLHTYMYEYLRPVK